MSQASWLLDHLPPFDLAIMPSPATAMRPQRAVHPRADDERASAASYPPLTLVPDESERDDSRSFGIDDPVPLWNPHLAALLSLVFTPVFGAWLHCSNAVLLGDPRLRRVGWMWLGVALAFTASGLYLVSAGQLAPTSAFSASALLGGYTLVWYAFAGHKQSRVIARLGHRHWRPRSFLQPVALASLLMALPALIVWVQRHL
ncbi:MAG: hypothetical protein RL375_316 [Pseudomonadota bacterium]|jgi:hypothetical protein